MVEFQWFLIALSVRPGRALAISAQRFPFDCMRAQLVWFGLRFRIEGLGDFHLGFKIEGLGDFDCMRV